MAVLRFPHVLEISPVDFSFQDYLAVLSVSECVLEICPGNVVCFFKEQNCFGVLNLLVYVFEIRPGDFLFQATNLFSSAKYFVWHMFVS